MKMSTKRTQWELFKPSKYINRKRFGTRYTTIEVEFIERG